VGNCLPLGFVEDVASHLSHVQMGLRHGFEGGDVFDPVIVDAVRQAAEDVLGVLHPFRQGVVNVFVAGLAVRQVQQIRHFCRNKPQAPAGVSFPRSWTFTGNCCHWRGKALMALACNGLGK